MKLYLRIDAPVWLLQYLAHGSFGVNHWLERASVGGNRLSTLGVAANYYDAG